MRDQATQAKKTTEQLVREQVELLVGIDRSAILPSSHLVNDLGCDSLDRIEIVMALEEEFEIEIPDEDAEKLFTVQQMIDYIEKRQRH